VKINSLIDNCIDISKVSFYASILGESPSKGARSPVLWDEAFKKNGINAKMVPMDVNKKKIIDLLNVLEKDNRFIGGAVAFPYKEIVANWLGSKRLTKGAYSIGAVNCLYRDKNNKLAGTNTDGEAALLCMESAIKLQGGGKVLQLGCGGAGKAVATFVSNKNNLTIAVRDISKVLSFSKKLGVKLIHWSDIDKYLPEMDVLINTTNIGFQSKEDSPLSKRQIDALPNNSLVYDIVYDPCPTKILKLAESSGHLTMDGICMNLEQAVIAFNYAVPEISLGKIRSIMRDVFN
jgi:shikimate dehydrogenase